MITQIILNSKRFVVGKRYRETRFRRLSRITEFTVPANEYMLVVTRWRIGLVNAYDYKKQDWHRHLGIVKWDDYVTFNAGICVYEDLREDTYYRDYAYRER